MSSIKATVRETYGEIAKGQGARSCCGPTCCTPGASEGSPGPDEAALRIGYSERELGSVPTGANLGLGCGNPQAIAALAPGEVVLDLGSGGGFDCFLAASRVGRTGHVIGVDMTAEMIALARTNAERAGAPNVEFRLGEIEHLPVADESVDVIMSNCVINLSPDKAAVFREAFRVLKPGGRLAISDVVATGPVPERLRTDPSAIAACVGGAAQVIEIEGMLAQAGFRHIRVAPREETRALVQAWTEEPGLDAPLVSATIEARRPS